MAFTIAHGGSKASPGVAEPELKGLPPTISSLDCTHANKNFGLSSI